MNGKPKCNKFSSTKDTTREHTAETETNIECPGRMQRSVTWEVEYHHHFFRLLHICHSGIHGVQCRLCVCVCWSLSDALLCGQRGTFVTTAQYRPHTKEPCPARVYVRCILISSVMFIINQFIKYIIVGPFDRYIEWKIASRPHP